MSSTSSRSGLAALALGSIGVVYGDIGTSPLYAFRESLASASGHGGPIEQPMVLGILSLILWSLIIIVTLKYIVLLMKADNQGEGGILSLMALAQQATGTRTLWVLGLGITGAALFYGDALITPAISVLSAVEGLTLITPHFAPYVIPAALAIMCAVFFIQSRGTAKVAQFFGPLMLCWFITLGWGGLLHIQDTPVVWQALNPYHAYYFLTHYGLASLIALGAVFLAVTGGEALYADLGHFGKRPIRMAWVFVVMPALVLNYFGQAALVLTHPEAAANSFFLLYPESMLPFIVFLATLATIIASQSVITGAFSLTHQAIQLGLIPRMTVRFTSQDHAGQIYLPQLNWAMLAGVIILILMFRTSGNIAAAYGIAVTGTMVITALLAYTVMRHSWHWPLPAALAIIAPLLLVDASFLTANLLKFFNGGYVSFIIASVLMLVMFTWVRGSSTLHAETRNYHHTMESVFRDISHYPPTRVSGTAIYLTSNTSFAPTALLQNLKHNKVLHERNLLLTLRITQRPYVPESERLHIEPIHKEFTRIYMDFGFMEPTNVAKGLQLLREDKQIDLDLMTTSFFISRRNIIPSARFGMPLWQDHIYITLANNASDAADYFHIPRGRVVELGVQTTV